MRNLIMAGAAALALGLGSAVSAATVTIGVESFGFGGGATNVGNARAAQAAFHSGAAWSVVEDFEGFAAGPAGETLSTAVGDFSSIDPVGTGTSNLSPDDQLQVRDGSGNTGSRFNTTLGGSNWLDSNDNSGILLEIPGAATLGAFDRLSFLATDIDDVGRVTFNIMGDAEAMPIDFTLSSTLAGARPNGELLLFTFLFDPQVLTSNLSLKIDAGDGFGIDDVTVSAVPLPAGAWLLLSGIGAFAALRRRRAVA